MLLIVGIKHPNMWFLCDKMYKEFVDVEKEMKSLEAGVKIRRPKKKRNVLNSRRLRMAEQKLRAGRNGYDAMAFLREASHSFRESNAEYFSRLLESLDDDPDLGGDIPDDESDQDEENAEEQVETRPIEEQENAPEPDNDANLCILCLTNVKDSVLVPCGHAKFCFDCGNRCIHEFVGNAPTCPYCRQPVMSCMKFYS